MSETETKAKPYYRNVEDTLEDVGITQRQMGYWRKHGLFNPELGPKTRYFTQEDTERLRFLKQLIDDLGLPIDTVKHLIESVGEPYESIGLTPTFSYINVSEKKLVHPFSAIDYLMTEAVTGAPYLIDNWFKIISLHILKRMANTSTTAQVHDAHLQELHGKIRHLDLMARLNKRNDSYWFWPARDDDPKLTHELGERLLKERDELYGAIRRAEKRRDPFSV
jgi:DNA-binding transcriptional MerR regulator